MSSSARISIELVATGDQEVQSALKATGKAAEELGEKLEKSSASATEVFETFLGAAVGVNKMADEAVKLGGKLFDLQKVQLGVTSATQEVESAQTELMEKQQALNELVGKGVTAGLEYEIAAGRVKEAEGELVIAQKELEISQGELTKSYFEFGASVIPAVEESYKGFMMIKQAVTGDTWKYVSAIIQERFATQASAAAHAGSIGAMIAHKAATVASTLATQGLAFATRLLHLAMGPVGWIILGIGTALTLFATNAFGVRDAINEMGKAIGNAFPIMKPLLDGLAYIANTLFPDASKESSAMSDQINKDFTSMQGAAAQSATTQAGSLTDVSASYASASASVSQSMRGMEQAVNVSTGSMIDDLEALKGSLGDVGISGSSISKGIAANVSKSFATASTTGVPNPLGGTIQVSNPMFGTIPLSEIRQNPLSTSIAKLGPVPSDFGTREITINTNVNLDGVQVGKAVNKVQARAFV